MKTFFIKKHFLLTLLFASITLNSSAVDKKEFVHSSESRSTTSVDATEKLSEVITVKKLTFREKFKIYKQIRKEYKKARKMGVKEEVPMVVLYILAVLLPPVAVGIFTDWGEPTLWNLLFTIILWLPGVVHAFYILLR